MKCRPQGCGSQEEVFLAAIRNASNTYSKPSHGLPYNSTERQTCFRQKQVTQRLLFLEAENVTRSILPWTSKGET